MADRRSLTLHLDRIDDDQYNDIAAAVWAAVQGIKRAARFEAEMVVDDPDRKRDVEKRIYEQAEDFKYAKR